MNVIAPMLRFEALQELVAREVALLDAWKLDEWLTLYAPECAYWVPSEWDQDSPHTTISHIYDDRRLLETRVRRFKHAMFHAQKPPSRTLRMTTNFRPGPEPGTILCHYEVAEFRNAKHRRYVARARYDATGGPAGPLIARKRLDLLDCDAVQDGISIIL